MSIVGCVQGASKDNMLQFSLSQPFGTSFIVCAKVERFENANARERRAFVQEGAERLDFWQCICIVCPDELARPASILGLVYSRLVGWLITHCSLGDGLAGGIYECLFVTN